MSSHSTSGPSLRGLFEQIVEAPPDLRQARIAALDLPPTLRIRLQAMVAFDESAAPTADVRDPRLAELNVRLTEKVRSILGAGRGTADLPGHGLSGLAAANSGQTGDVEADQSLGQAMVGTCVGSFRLRALIGDGGSSTVFRATREVGDGEQVVALKLLRHGLYSTDAQRRFRREQAILAQLTHPNIARLVEGGVSASGIPYIAMELVEGLPITRAADARGLNLEQRLAWCVKLCRTLEAAHSSLIVHRDLKPSNLLVTAEGELKVLDFGIAKLVDGHDATLTQTIALTPEYAAPEQYGPGASTTAVDVYSIGVLLGELVTGIRLVPGMRASSEVAAAAGRLRLPEGLPPRGALVRRLRGELDAILSNALAEEPARRYRSAAAFAEDIERYLIGKPVRALPPSSWYRARKFVTRHRGGVAAGAGFVVAILASLGIVAWQAHSIAREAQRAQSTRDFLLSVFSAAEPAGPRLGPPTVADVVRASIVEAQQSHSLQPSVRIELIDALGGVLRKQGDTRNSLQLLEDNYRTAVATLGASDPATLLAGLGLAQSRIEGGLHASARLLLDDLIDKGRRGAASELLARLLSTSAYLGSERFERERALAESAGAVAICAKGCNDRTRIVTLVTRGSVLSSFNDEPAAIPVLEQALELQRRLFGGPHVEIADTLETLSRAYRRTGQLDRAEALARESLAIVEASLPDPHQRRSSALDSLRQVLIDSRKFDEAIALGLRVIAMDEATRGPGHTGLGTDHNTLGFTYMLRGDYANAAAHFRSALAVAETIPDNDRRVAIYRADLGYSIGLGGDLAQARQLIQTALSRFRAQPEIDYSEVSSALEKLGDLERRAGHFDEALATYRQSDAIYRQYLKTGPTEWHARTLIGLGRTLAESGRNDLQAEGALREAIAKITAPSTRLSPLRVEAKAALAELLGRNGNALDARRFVQQTSDEAKLAPGTLPADGQALLQRALDTIGAATR